MAVFLYFIDWPDTLLHIILNSVITCTMYLTTEILEGTE